MNFRIRYIICPVLAIAAVVGGIVISDGEVSRRSHTDCSGIVTTFNDSLCFVDSQDVKNIITKEYGSFIGQPKDSVRLGRIEKILEKNCYIGNAELWITDDGVLHARIDQYKPAVLLRDAGFYYDRDMTVFPVKVGWEAGVNKVGGTPVSKGKELKCLMSGILDFYDTVDKSDVWREKIDSVYIGKDDEIFLKCKGFDGFFIFGKPEEIERKLSAMETFFDRILPEQKEYISVNLKYNNQIICRKDI